MENRSSSGFASGSSAAIAWLSSTPPGRSRSNSVRAYTSIWLSPTCSDMPMLAIASNEAVRQLAVVLHADLDLARRAPACATRSRASSAWFSDSVMPTTSHAVLARRVDREAAPAAADVEHAHPRLQVELAGDQLEFRALRLLERLCAAREDRAAVGHRVVEEQREELVADVVVVANRRRVALGAVQAPAAASARGPDGCGSPPGARPRRAASARRTRSATAQRRRLELVDHQQRAVEIVDRQRAVHVGAAEAERARARTGSARAPSGAARRTSGALLGGRGDGVAVPEAHVERPRRKHPLQLAAKWSAGA